MRYNSLSVFIFFGFSICFRDKFTQSRPMGQANLSLFALAASGQHSRSREACHHLRYLCIL